MSNYNFTMKQFNGSSYDTLYPKSTSQQVLLNDSALATKLGLSGTPTVNDVLNNGTLYGEVVSYTGNGTYGETNACSITFTSPPKAVFFIGTGTSGVALYDAWMYEPSKFVLNPNSLTTSYVMYRGFAFRVQTQSSEHSYGKKSSDNKTFSWYSDSRADTQLNTLDVTYYFLGVW